MYYRHGHRYPSLKDMRAFAGLNDKLGDFATAHNFTWNPFELATDKLLNRVGEQDLFELGRRVAARFPQALRDDYSPLDYKFVRYESCDMFIGCIDVKIKIDFLFAMLGSGTHL